MQDSVLGFRYFPNANGTMRFPAYTRNFSINKWGFPGKNFNLEKDSGTYRIALIGTSDDCGLFTNGPLNYASLLEDSLRKTGHKVEIINLSIDGSNKSVRNITLAGGECLKYKPDLVLLRNEYPVTEDTKTKFRSTYKGIEIKYAHPSALDSAKLYIDKHLALKQFQHYVIDYCYIYRFLIRANYRYNIPILRIVLKNTTDSYIYWAKNLLWTEIMDKRNYNSPVILTDKQSIQLLKDTKARLDSNKTSLILYDIYKGQYDKDYKKIYKENGLNYISLDIAYNEDYSFGTMDGHTSQKGHIIIAKTFFDIFPQIPELRNELTRHKMK